jgi:hypothetical protein
MQKELRVAAIVALVQNAEIQRAGEHCAVSAVEEVEVWSLQRSVAPTAGAA